MADPDQADLDAMLSCVSTVRVWNDGVGDGKPMGDTLLLEAGDEDSLRELGDAIRVHNRPAGHCMCDGEPTLEFLDRDGVRLAVIGLHHGHSMRWNRWDEDADLVAGKMVLDWLAARGASEPLETFEEDLRRGLAAEASYALFLETMPDCLRPLWETMLASSMKTRVVPDAVQDAIAEAYPDEKHRVRVLLAWYGNGERCWNSFPSYEGQPAALLLLHEGQLVFEAIADVIDSGEATPEQLEGAARYFCSWEFNNQQQENPVDIGSALKASLLGFVERQDRTENLDSARYYLA